MFVMRSNKGGAGASQSRALSGCRCNCNCGVCKFLWAGWLRRGFAHFGVFWVFLRSEISYLAQEFALTPRNKGVCEFAQSGDSFCRCRDGGKVNSSFNLPKIGRWQSTMPNVAGATRRGQIQFVASNSLLAATLLTTFSYRLSAQPVGPRSQSLAWPTPG